MSLIDLMQKRYTTKAFDPSRKLSDEQLKKLEQILRLSPSSTNAQPWHFVIAATDQGKEKIASAMQGEFSYNIDKVKKASHVVVLCSRPMLTDEHLDQVLAKEDDDGRFKDDDAREKMRKTRQMYARQHQLTARDIGPWVDKQVYIALGVLLLGAVELGLDACPMEGFDQAALDKALDLTEQGLSSTVVVALGYRSEDDFNAKLPKSRLATAQVITHI